MKSYKDTDAYKRSDKPHFPLPFADRPAGYAVWQERARLERRVAAARLV